MVPHFMQKSRSSKKMKMKKVFCGKVKKRRKAQKSYRRRANDPLPPSQPWNVCSLTEDPISVAAPGTPAPGKEDQGLGVSEVHIVTCFVWSMM